MTTSERRLLLAVARTVQAMLMALHKGQALSSGQVIHHISQIHDAIKLVDS